MTTTEIRQCLDVLTAKTGLSLYAIAESSLLTSQTLYQWYHGKRKPSLSAIEAVCKACKINVIEFLSYADENRPTAMTQEMQQLWNQLTEKQRDAVLSVAKSFIE